MSAEELERVLTKRLPGIASPQIGELATAYLQGVEEQALARTTGAGPVPTTLSSERAELLAFVSRSQGRLLTEDEIAALLRITPSTARAVSRTMLAVYDDLPVLALKTAFGGARRDGRGSEGAIADGYIVVFTTEESMNTAMEELRRQRYLLEIKESSGSRHVLLIDPRFPIDDAVPARNR